VVVLPAPDRAGSRLAQAFWAASKVGLLRSEAKPAPAPPALPVPRAVVDGVVVGSFTPCKVRQLR
jgi:hypothetical protein